MKRHWFSLPVALWASGAHFFLFVLVATVPDILRPDLEFQHSFRDDIETWLLAPALIVWKLWPHWFSGDETPWVALILGLPFCSVTWGCLIGGLWPQVMRRGRWHHPLSSESAP